MIRHLALGLFFCSFAARASSVSYELSANTTQATNDNPRTGSLGNALNASLDLSERWALNLGALVTLEGQPAGTSRFVIADRENSSAVAQFSLGLDFEATDNLTFGVHGDFSPQSTQFTLTAVPLPTGVANALVRSTASERTAGADASYDTAGDSALEWSFFAGADVTAYDLDQTVIRTESLNGTQLRDAIRAYCATHPRQAECSRSKLSALSGTPDTLNSEHFLGGITAIAWRDTDLTISGDYYHYEEDPARLGLAGLVFSGRTASTAGVPIAPLKYLVRPEVAHRFGDLSAKVWFQAGEYVHGLGRSTGSIGLKLTYKFTKSFRMWALGSGQRDVDDQGGITRSGTFALGAGYRF